MFFQDRGNPKQLSLSKPLTKRSLPLYSTKLFSLKALYRVAYNFCLAQISGITGSFEHQHHFWVKRNICCALR